MNETLRRALLRARLSEEDIAARLAVDPKTVRRWIEGRVPYLRHRWAVAGILGLDETDLWPEVSAARSRPEEVRAIYPHRDAVPGDMWRTLFGSAQREIGILDDTALFLAEIPGVLATLDDRARAGVRVRICIRDPNAPGDGPRSTPTVRIHSAQARYGLLRETGDVEIRTHQIVQTNCIWRADEKLLVGQLVYGVSIGHMPILYLHQDEYGEITTNYLESFERVWADARPLE